MQRFLAILLACALTAACTTTSAKLAFETSTKPAPGARVLLLQPEVSLAVLTAAGVQEPRADWSMAARDNLSREIEAQLKARSHNYKMLDPNDAMAGRSGQLLRLNSAVGQSILAFSYGAYPLPTKKDGFDWTLGEGVSALAESQGADYALFVNSQGTYASGGRVATMIGLAMLGVSVPLGQQQVFASLVELKTGRVVWFNVAVAGPNADMRETEGCASLVKSLLKTLPL